MERDVSILYPVFVLVAWTFAVLFRVAFVRLGSKLTPSDFKYGESSSVPPEVAIPNRNYMNLLELPVLFYVACILLFASGQYAPVSVTVAWLYVALRIVHSLIHLGHNNVMHRLAVFAVSNFVLMGLWVCVWNSVMHVPSS